MEKKLRAISLGVAAVCVAIVSTWLIQEKRHSATPKPEGLKTHAQKSPREPAKGQQLFKIEKPTFKGSAEDAEAAWDRVEATTPIRAENDAELRKLIDSLCNSDRWQEALDLVLKKKGPGALRESLLSRLFFNIGNENTHSSVLAARNLPAEGDKEAANRGIRMAILSYFGPNAINLAPHQLAELKEAEITNLASALGNQMAADVRRQMPSEERLKKIQAILRIFDEASGLKAGEELDAITGGKLEFLTEACPMVRDVALAELEKVARSRLPSEAFGESSAKLVQALTRESPEDTANKLSLSDPLRKDVNLLGTSIAIWVRDDTEAAGKWLDANLPKVNDAQRDAVAFSMVAYYCSNERDATIANEWLSQISDEELKASAAKFIRRK